MKRAIIFQAVTQRKYLPLAAQASRSAKKKMRDVDTVVFTDLAGGKSKWIDRIVKVPEIPLLDAHLPRLLDLPREYDSGVYLGADAYVCAPLYDVFELVEDERTDAAFVHTSYRKIRDRYPSPGVPDAFPRLRGALIAFQNNDRVRAFFEDWARLFHKQKEEYAHLRRGHSPCHPDNMVMRVALYRSDLHIAVLPQNYCCTCGDVVIRGVVKTVTGARGFDSRTLAKEANRLAPHLRLFKDGKSKRL
jgi:hypothetical protein